MTAHPVFWPTRAPLTLRRLLLLMVAAGVAYVAVIAIVLAARITPAASSVREHGERVLAAHDAAGARIVVIDQSVTRVRRLRGAAPVAAESAAAAAAPIRAHLDSISAVGASAMLRGVPAQLRLALASAATEESALHSALLGALAALELGRLPEADLRLARAEDALHRTVSLLRAAQRMALADIVARQRRLGDLATFATRAVMIWLVAGVALLPLAALFVRRRLHDPLRDLETAVARVSTGDLHTSLPVEGEDELGRLGRLFNTMTAVLRQRTEDQLRHSEARYRAAFEHAALGMAELSPDGRFLRVNDAYCRFLGYAAAELLDMKESDIVVREDREDDQALYRAVVDGSLALYHREKRFLDAQGGARWGSMTASLVRTADGAGDYWLAIVEDTTERRNLEAQLAQAQKLESIGRLAGGVAHDFNNILTGIVAHQEFVLNALSPDHPAYEDLEEIGRAANRAADLTRQLLTFARRQVVEPRVVDLNGIVRNLDKLLRRLLGADVQLVTTLDPSLHMTRVDPTQFEQVVVNLAVNARDAMPRGGRLSLTTANFAVEPDPAASLSGMPPGRYVVMSVADDGTGMDSATMERIFEPFFTTKDRARGTGLGLPMVYGIVKQAGGHIDVSSEPGRGTTFRIYLPRVDAPADAIVPTAVIAPVSAGGNETVLLVEDESLVRDALRRGLQDHGFRVLAARDGTDALRLASSHDGPIELLVTDMVLPHISGREIAAQLATRRPAMKVLYISGYSEEFLSEPRSDDLAIALLRKPFTVAELVTRIRQILDVPVGQTT